jgi:DNA polymerase-3 subunit alpha
MFVPLRNHSHYSLLLSTARCNQIAEKCAKSGYKYAGLTDLGTVSGCVNFIQACKKHDLKPIIGSEIKIKDSGTLTLICKNNSAWRELLVLISLCNDPENYNKQPEISFDDLVKTITPDNFIVIDGYVGSHLFYHLFKDISGALCYQDYDSVKSTLHCDWRSMAQKHLLSLHHTFNSYYLEVNLEEFDTIPVIKIMTECVSDLDPHNNITIPDSASYYCDSQDSVDHRVLLCAKLKTTLKKLDARILETENFDLIKFTRSSKFHIKNDWDATKYPKTLTNNMLKLADQCEDLTILSNPRLPKFDCPKGMKENDYLKQLCRDGWAKFFQGKLDKDQTIIYRDRVLKELAVIEKANLAGYFLIVQDYVNHFRNQGCLVGPARGSGGGSDR